MKKFFMVAQIFVFLAFFTVSCNNETSSVQQNADTAIADKDAVAAVDNEAATTNEADTTVVKDETAVDEDTVDEDTVDTTEIPDESTFQKIGDFNLNFTGQVNTNLSDYTKIKGGKGKVTFNYKGTPFTYGELTVVIVQLFPLAILQGSNVAVMWLESAPGLGATTKKVFGYTFPTTIQLGTQAMSAVQAMAFYGDIDINLQGGQFNIKCIRAASNQGTINITTYDGSNANFTSNGDLLDPAAAGSSLPYPVCPD